VALPAEPGAPIAMSAEPPALKIRPPYVVGLRPGAPFLWTVPVTGRRPLAFSARGLPPGLHLDPASGTITGRTPAAGDYTVRLQVRNAAGRDAQAVRLVAGSRVALTPPMGWNSYDGFGDDVTEAEVLANARYMQREMQPYGWDTVVVDFRWYDPGTHATPNQPWRRAGAPLTMDRFGRLMPSSGKFPSATRGKGFADLARQVHALGLKFGIHIMRGIPRNAVKQDLPIEGSSFKATEAADTRSTCPWCPDMYGVRGETPAGQAYYDSLFRLYASWGLDFVKVDDMSRPYSAAEVEAVRKAIDKCGRAIVLSLSPGATPVSQAAHVATYANLWREADDFWDSWAPLNNEFTLGDAWRDAVGPGHWPDGDMLPVGHLSVGNRSVGEDRRTHFTDNEQLTLLSLWALLPAPLMVGANLPDNDPRTRALLTNPEVLAVNQDALGTPGTRVSPPGDQEVWVKPLADGSRAAGLFNKSFFPQLVTVRWSDLGISGVPTMRDLWQRRDIGAQAFGYATVVPAHGAVLLRVPPAGTRPSGVAESVH